MKRTEGTANALPAPTPEITALHAARSAPAARTRLLRLNIFPPGDVGTADGLLAWHQIFRQHQSYKHLVTHSSRKGYLPSKEGGRLMSLRLWRGPPVEEYIKGGWLHSC